jgi:hypothetical protein
MTNTKENTNMNEPTDINGIERVCEGLEAANHYAVKLTLYVDAANVEEVSQRAMLFRNRVGDGYAGKVYDLPFYWELHDHDGC